MRTTPLPINSLPATSAIKDAGVRSLVPGRRARRPAHRDGRVATSGSAARGQGGLGFHSRLDTRSDLTLWHAHRSANATLPLMTVQERKRAAFEQGQVAP